MKTMTQTMRGKGVGPVGAAFDPALPEDGALVVAGVLRDQFNGLNDRISEIPEGPPGPPGEVTVMQLNQAIFDQSASNVTWVGPLTQDIASASYSQGEMQAVMDKLNELIMGLWRV